MKNKGFTLIELLVVVAIIGILASIVLGSLSSARARARDANRLSDVKTIQTALELYYLDNGVYPMFTTYSHEADWQSDLGDALGITLPVDPINISLGDVELEGHHTYSYDARNNSSFCFGDMYIFGFQLEGKNGDGPLDGVQRCSSLFDYGSGFAVGVDVEGNFITPDLSGTPK